MFYRIQHGLVDICKEDYLKGDSRTRTRFFQERITSKIYGNTFFPKSIVYWNRLPSSVTTTDSLEIFRARLTASRP